MSGRDWANVHATALVVGDRGVLIRGRSGSGKSSLALALVARCRAEGRFARLVADDRIDLAAANGRLLARAPAAIAGLCEVHGLGPHPVAHEPHAVIDLVVNLVPADQARRYSEDLTDSILGCMLPALALDERNQVSALAAVFAWLEQRAALPLLPSRRFDLPRQANDLGLSTRIASTR